ncbi:MAG: hypothetical protein AB7I30_18670 [Isosphaeraceae bacterium]
MSTTTLSARYFPLSEPTFRELVERVRRQGLALGVGGLVLGLVVGFFSPIAFFPAYLATYLFFLGLGIGSLALLMLHHLVGGAWGFAIRRPLEAASMTLPVLALLFLPIALGMRTLYPWTDPAFVSEHAAVAAKSGYLNVGFWSVRAVLYHAIWSGLALLFHRNSILQDTTEDPSPTWRNQALSPPGLILVFLSVTFAMVDWAMSIEPEWYSTIYGVMLLIGMGLSALALAVAVSTPLREVWPIRGVTDAEGYNDLGNLLLAFVMLWAYMSFSQYLIIWMGNIAEEVPWYVKRSEGAWRWVCATLMVLHFALPFVLLLVRDNKREPGRLWKVAALIFAFQFVNDLWLIVPAFPSPQWRQLIATAPALVGVGGVWAACYAWLLGSRPLIPQHDPLLAEVHGQHPHGGGHRP